MYSLHDLERRRFQAVQSAATAAPVDGIAFRTLICMLSTVDLSHWAKHGELVSFVSFDTLERTVLASKASIAKARRRLIAWGLLARLTPAELRGQPAVYRINTSPHVPLPFPARMREVLAERKRQRKFNGLARAEPPGD
jgi:hypothetical protein